MHQITRVSCRFYAGEFDHEGRMTNELPIAAGDREFNAVIYYPFTQPLAEAIAEIERRINEQAGWNGAPGQEPGLQAGVCGVRGDSLGEASSLGEGAGETCGDESGGAQDPEADGGGPHQAVGEGGNEQQGQPATRPPQCQPQQRRSQGVIVVQGASSGAVDLLVASVEAEGRSLSREDAARYLMSDQFCNEKSVCFVAYVKGIPVGIIIGEWHCETHERYYEVRSLYVTPSARGGSVAKRLMEAAVSWAGEDDAPIFMATEGEPREFYTALGFVPTHRVNVTTLNAVRERLRS